MVVSSGFAEAGEEGRALQDQLRDAALRNQLPVLGPNVEGFVNYVDQVAPYGTTPPATPSQGRHQRHLAVGHGRVDDEPDGLGPRRRPADHPGRRQRGRPGPRRPVRLGGRRPTDQGRDQLRRDDARRRRASARGLDALRSRAEAGADLRAARGTPRRPCDRSSRTPAHSPGTPACATRGCVVTGSSWSRTPSRCSRRRCCWPTRRSSGPTVWPRRCSPAGRARCSPRPRGPPTFPCRSTRRATKTALKRALPSYASQNNPLDVTGQAAVETDMFVDALVGAGERSERRARGVRRVPTPVAGRDPVGGSGAVQGDRAAAFDGRGVRVAVR